MLKQASVAQFLQALAGGQGVYLVDAAPGSVVHGANFPGDNQGAGFGFRQLQVLESTQPGQIIRPQEVVKEQADNELFLATIRLEQGGRQTRLLTHLAHDAHATTLGFSKAGVVQRGGNLGVAR